MTERSLTMLLGLEIAAHYACAVLADAQGVAQFTLRREFAPYTPPATCWLAAMDLCRDLLHRAAAESSAVSRVGVAFDAPVNGAGIVQKDPTRPGWEGYDLGRGVREHLGIQDVVAISRANAEGLGEAQFGALRGLNDWLYLHIGRVFESSLCIEGKLRLGTGRAGDIGGLVIERDGALDAYGGRGTLRAYCGGAAFESRARSYSLTFTNASEVWDVASSNFAAQSLIEDFISRLALGLTGAYSLIDPRHICIGGAFGHAIWPRIREPLASKLRDNLPLRASDFLLVPAQLGDDAAPLGALTLALHRAT